jgi:lysophospholipase L1-like esterase
MHSASNIAFIANKAACTAFAQYASVTSETLGVSDAHKRSFKRIAFIGIFCLGIPAAAFAALEGMSSLVLFARAAFVATRPLFPEEVSTEYDSEFGWIAKKSFSSPNLYGPGVGLSTNSRGFRGMAPVSDVVPNGKRRLVCSGDSFTLGWGVADDETWCSQLGDGNLDAVNMGQGGYGIDQAYLWYRRDGRTLEHDVHLFAFVTHDFTRMAMDRFLGYAKPRLVLDADSLRVVGVPVVRRDKARLARRFERAVKTLRTSQLLGGLTRGSAAPRGDPAPDSAGTRAVFARLVAELDQVNRAKHSRLVLVYLPNIDDFTNDGASAWREQTRRIADSLGVAFVDLIPELRRLSKRESQQLYFSERDEMRFIGATGHFNAEGSRWAARAIKARLDSLGVVGRGNTIARAAR